MMDRTIFVAVLVVMAMFGSAYGQTTKEDLEYQARLEYCYNLIDDISNDFGWWWQEQKKAQYNEVCGEILGYIEVDEGKLNYGR